MSVSVIVRTFNSAESVNETVSAILAQSLADLQLILVDDGSKDASATKCQAWAERDPRVEVILNQNVGDYGAIGLNSGLSRATKDYIAICDADDVWESDKLAVQVDFMAANLDHALCFTRVKYIDAEGRPSVPNNPNLFRGPESGRDLVMQLVQANFLCHSAALWRRASVPVVGAYDQSLPFCADWDYWLRLAIEGKISVIPRSLVRYRVHTGNSSQAREYKLLRDRQCWRTIFKNLGPIHRHFSLPLNVHHSVLVILSELSHRSEDWAACLGFLKLLTKLRPLSAEEARWQRESMDLVGPAGRQRRPRESRPPLRLHLGCGPNILEGWQNLDLAGGPEVTPCDLRGPLPFSSMCASTIFSEQFFEHLTFEEGLRFLKECHRVLMPGGTVRITTPDLKTIVADYLAGQTNRWVLQGFSPQSPCHMVNGMSNNWGHRFLYDETELAASLGEAGFTNIRRLAWHASDVPDLRKIEFRNDCRDLILQADRRA